MPSSASRTTVVLIILLLLGASLCAGLNVATSFSKSNYTPALAPSSSIPATAATKFCGTTTLMEPMAHAASLLPDQLQGTSSPTWDEQIGLSFTQDFSAISYNVTAIAQSDSDGYGPAYLLNGLTTSGYWYQVGLSYDWEPGIGFAFTYEVFNNRGSSIFPTNGGGGLANFSGPVRAGDIVLLSLYFQNGNVIMYSFDWNTSANAEQTYSAEGASLFTGDTSSPANQNGFFTGLMTEEYHSAPYTSSEERVVYSDPAFELSSAWQWADEYDVNNNQLLFASQTNSPVSFESNPNTMHAFYSNGTSQEADAYYFITGAGVVPVTLSYSTTGTNSYIGSAPTLNYTYAGNQESVNLTQTLTTYVMDQGSTWSVLSELPNSTLDLRWMTDQEITGVASSSTTIAFTYQEQFYVMFSSTVFDGGTGYSPPTVDYYYFGGLHTAQNGTSVWVDSGSSYSYPLKLTGSSQFEAWVNYDGAYAGTVTDYGVINVEYVNSYNISFGYSIVGGNTTNVPEITFSNYTIDSQQVKTETLDLDYGQISAFVPAGTKYNVSSVISGSSTSQRWALESPLSGTITAPSEILPVYYHQYNLTLSFSVIDGGSPSSSPSASGLLFGIVYSTLITRTPASYWFDATGTINFTDTIAGAQQERWITNTPSLSASSGSSTFNVEYYHQYEVDVSYSVTMGASGYSPPELVFTNLSLAASFILTPAPAPIWMDAGSWSVTGKLIDSNSTVQWITTGRNGTVSPTISIDPVYYEQFFVTLSIFPSGDGTIFPSSSQWYNSDTVIQIAAHPSSNYSFGGWSSNTSSIQFGDASLSSTTATIDGGGMIRANFNPIIVTSSSSSSSSFSTSSSSSFSSSASTSSSSTTKVGGPEGGFYYSTQVIAFAIVVVLLVLSACVVIARRSSRKK